MNNTANLDIANEPSNYFVIFPTRLLQVCSHRQAILMGMILSLSNRHGYCYAKNKTLSTMLECSEISIKRDLRHLEANDLIRRQVIRSDTGEVTQRKIFVGDALQHPPMDLSDTYPQYQKDTDPQYQLDTKYSNNTNSNKNSNKAIVDTFEEIWKEYGKKGVKKTALRAWLKITSSQRQLATDHIPLYIANHKEHDKLPWLPHLATYINQERWNDDLPYGSDQAPRHIDWG